MICDNISRNDAGSLCFALCDLNHIVEKYGSPLYIMDEERIRKNCRTYYNAIKKYFGGNSMPIYAGKAAAFKEIYRIINDENLGIDVVSCGEIYTAKSAGFPMENAYFHSNNKTDEDIKFAINAGIGHFVIDNTEELVSLQKVASLKGIVQKAIIRITPGIDTHTYEAVSTGKVDSKFGFAIETGQADEIVNLALKCKNIEIDGFHCHIGSEVFDSDTFIRASEIMIKFIADVSLKYGINCKILDLGGGYGVRYVESDPYIDIEDNIRQVSVAVKESCKKYGVKVPAIIMEPGRSIVADAGITVYTVGMVKKIPGFKNYVSIDGGMSDNPRYALYGARYTVLPVNNSDSKELMKCSLVGRCCESGDIIQENIELPADIKRGDLVAVLTTGAYNYSMASNYNRIPRLPIVMIKEKSDRLVVRRETYDDLIACDL